MYGCADAFDINLPRSNVKLVSSLAEDGSKGTPQPLYPASGRRGNNLKYFNDFYLKAKAQIWSCPSCVCHTQGQILSLAFR